MQTYVDTSVADNLKTLKNRNLWLVFFTKGEIAYKKELLFLPHYFQLFIKIYIYVLRPSKILPKCFENLFAAILLLRLKGLIFLKILFDLKINTQQSCSSQLRRHINKNIEFWKHQIKRRNCSFSCSEVFIWPYNPFLWVFKRIVLVIGM